MARSEIKLECDSSVVLVSLIVLFGDGVFMLASFVADLKTVENANGTVLLRL